MDGKRYAERTRQKFVEHVRLVVERPTFGRGIFNNEAVVKLQPRQKEKDLKTETNY